MNGKQKCRILKEIRQEIAKNNDIEFITTECKHQGDCLGTCPKCEAEVRYLEAELDKRRRAGKAVAVAGIAATLLFSATACGNDSQPVATETSPTSTMEALQGMAPPTMEFMGEVYIPDSSPTPTAEGTDVPEPMGMMEG